MYMYIYMYYVYILYLYIYTNVYVYVPCKSNVLCDRSSSVCKCVASSVSVTNFQISFLTVENSYKEDSY